MATHQLFHEISIAAEPEVVFDHVTDPNHWRAWFLPIQPARHVYCTVSKKDRPYLWEVEAKSDRVDAVTSYTLSHADSGTVVKRQFRYTTKGWLRFVEPILFRRRIAFRARDSLEKLKIQVERKNP